MAGAGYKLYATGDVLTATDVNTYLQQQTVMRFASSAARTSALASVLAEGMLSYLIDTDAVEVYNGSAWVGVANAGDITGVTAGTGISGGGTSGDVTITNSMATAITTAGDLIKGTGSGTFNRLGIGSTSQVLTVVSGAPAWATPSAPSVTNGNNFVATSQTTTSTSYTDLATAQAVTITTGTKALVLLCSNLANSSASSGTRMAFAISGATTVAAADEYGINWAAGNAGDTVKYGGSFYVTGLTAGSNVFTAKFKVSAGTGTFNSRFITVIDMGS
jgi:hypothetical protein